MKNRVCKSCGYIGRPVRQPASTFIVDGAIWLACAGFAAGFSFPLLLLIPLAWSLYHIARYRTVTCPRCGELEMAPMKSGRGQDAIHRFHHNHEHHA